MFSYGQKGSADQFRMTLEKIGIYAGSKCGTDIATEITTREMIMIDKPEHSQEILDRHADAWARRQLQRLMTAKEGMISTYQARITADPTSD